jgi:hypothetical protein
MGQKFLVSVWQADEWFVTQCLDIDVASQGHSRAEALENLCEALKLHFTPPCATITPHVTSIEVDLHAA